MLAEDGALGADVVAVGEPGDIGVPVCLLVISAVSKGRKGVAGAR